MSRNNIKFTNDYKILCEEIVEGDGVTTTLPFDSSYKVYATEFIENDSPGNIKYDSSKKITAYRFEEGENTVQIYDPTTYISTFVSEITYSTSAGFTVTNFNTLLTSTGTTPDKWGVGILYYHREIHRSTAARTNSQENGVRHFRTTWGKYCDNFGMGGSITINSNGNVSNSNIGSMAVSVNDEAVGQENVLIGIRLRYGRNTQYRSRYSNKLYIPGTSTSVNTDNYIL